ncbi:MAG: M14 family metallocarboxypeptidase [Nitrospira sp.]|nr:M14 family metallocarboxypeptidase [Nitrospira sp.]
MSSYLNLIKRVTNLADIEPDVIGNIKGLPFYSISYGYGNKNIALSAGIHGDEPAGVEAILHFLEGNEGESTEIKKWTDVYKFTIFPCTNPTGYERNTRENFEGIDLNRWFGNKTPPAEVELIQNAIKGKRFSFYMDFHEDIDGEGFYLYEVGKERERTLAEGIIKSVSLTHAIDMRQNIDGLTSSRGIISPNPNNKEFPLKKSNLPLPVYLFIKGVPHCITTESPTLFSFEERVRMHLTALNFVLTHNS